MPALDHEFCMIAAHCLLCGFVLGASIVMEKYGLPLPVAAFTVWIGNAERTKRNAMSPKVTPLAVSLKYGESIFFGFEVDLAYLTLFTLHSKTRNQHLRISVSDVISDGAGGGRLLLQ